MSETRDCLIIALDVDSARQAQQIVQAVGESASTFKVGKQLFTAEGPQVVRDLISSGKKVFLDLKFHDIPNTVSSAVRQACELRVSMLTVHASGGSKMLRAAADAAGNATLVLAVTVLTSLGDTDLAEIGIAGNVQAQVLRLAALARANGIRGLVASARTGRRFRDRDSERASGGHGKRRSGAGCDAHRCPARRRQPHRGWPADYRGG
jgi:orotidine-5'-phosphate decarboxylase